jgi:predicted RecB family nuclease
MQESPRLITASMLYNHLVCPHRVTMDAFAAPERRDPVSPFIEMLWARGNKYEAQVVGGLGEPLVDLSRLAGDEKESATRAAIAAGAALIYNGRLSDGGLLGEPDLLRREGDGYVAIDIKSGAGEEGGGEEEPGKLKRSYGVQIALYTDLLMRLGIAAGRYGYILDIHGAEVRYDFDAPLSQRDTEDTLWSRYLEAQIEVGRLLLHREPASRPALASACKLCVWRSACLAEVRAADDLTLLPELGRAKRDVLCGAFPTVHALAAADVTRYVRGGRTEFPGIGPVTLAKLQARAALVVQPQAQPYFREPVTLPPTGLELFFDIETDPLRDLCYLHGFVLRENGDPATERFVAFFAEPETAEAERDAFAAAWTFIEQHAEAVLVYYSKYERTVYRALAAKYPQVCSREAVNALFASVRAFDLYSDAVKQSEWPTLDHSVKALAKHCGFAWRDTDPSGASSIQWFDEWVTTRNPAIKQRILDYNEDDCVAMRVVLDRMRGMGVGGA